MSRHSVRLQGDTDGFVATDTLVLNGKKAPPADAYQMKLQLFSAAGRDSDRPLPLGGVVDRRAGAGRRSRPAIARRARTRCSTVPEHSQMVYPDGGNVWCSPTSVSMVLAYWNGYLGQIPATGPIETRPRRTVDGVYDWIYDGHGNWPFNTACAAHRGHGGVRSPASPR